MLFRSPFIYDADRYAAGTKRNGMVGGRVAIWRLSGQEIPVGHKLVMTCKNRTCLRREHMQPMTFVETQQFAILCGAYKSLKRSVAGVVNARKNAKINAGIAAEIRADVAAGRRRKEIAAERGLCRSTIDQIVRGDRWAVTFAPNASVFHMAAAA